MTSEDQTDRIQQLEKRIEELENKQQLSKYSRRGLLAGVAGVAGLGAMSGSGAAASGQVGTANNRVNVFADEIDANNVTGAVQGCRVFLSSDQTITAGGKSQVQFDNVVYDSDGNFDTTSHEWTCPEDGVYAITAQTQFVGGNNGDRRQLTIGNTGAAATGEGAVAFREVSETFDRFDASTINKYAQGDVIAAFAENRDSGDTLASGDSNGDSFLEVVFLGGL